ncbi:MAG: UDP-3-O-acyl-N-acetylglucosamine deacetylase [Deltaproteobacteria bacterium]|nr:UDP-3-O-acyl-N-acetylglucosamine deacetylase [Deltaproteobacteria bacterium]
MFFQRTLKKEISCVGIGLHSGIRVKLVMKPAPAGHGLRLQRVDRGRVRAEIPALSDYVVDTSLATTLGIDEKNTIGTVEHLLSAFSGLGVDNALIEVHGPEVPIMDGSANPFVYLIKTAGIKRQVEPKRYLRMTGTVTVSDGDKWARLGPQPPSSDTSLSIISHISFDHPLIGSQSFHFSFSDVVYDRQISRARTFGFLHEVEWMKSRNLALGGSLDNAIVLDEYSILNDSGLRFPDEFARHKVLDCFGDVTLLGMPLIGVLEANKTGHALNHKLVQAVLANAEAWEPVTAAEWADGTLPPFTVPRLVMGESLF